MITDDEVSKALLYLAESARAYADARALRCYLEEIKRTVHSNEFLKSTRSTVAEREAEANDSVSYRTHLEKMRDAVRADELLRAYRVAAEARIELYRTQESSRRASNIS